MINSSSSRQNRIQTSDTDNVDQTAISFSKFTKAIQWCLIVLVFLVPVLFLPWTSEFREFNKQQVLFFGVMIMLGVWVIRILTTRSISWVKTSLDYILLVYLIVYLLASQFSLDRVSSYLGYYGRFTGSFISVLVLVVLYYLIVNNVRNEKLTRRILNVLSVAGGAVILHGFIQLLGKNVFGMSTTTGPSFNLVGSMVALSIFSALFLILFQWMWLNFKLRKATSLLLWVFSLLALAVIFIINATVGWLILALGLIVFIALSTVLTPQSNQSPNWFWKPLILLIISILFFSFRYLPSSVNPRNQLALDLPLEIQLSNSSNWNLVANSLKASPKQAILGAGPGTVGIAFGNIKSPELNKTIVWNLTFDRASSEIANIAIETGILGLLVFELTCLLFLAYALYFLIRKPDHPGRSYALGLFVIWFSLYLTHFFYFYNTVFYFLFWLTLALFMAVTHWEQNNEENRQISFNNSPRAALSWMFISLLILGGLLVGTFFQAAVYGAEVAYASGLKLLNQPNPDFGKVDSSFSRARALNPYRDVYFLAHAQNLVYLASQEGAKPEPNITQFQTWMAESVADARKATELSPAKASNWSALAQFYQNIRPLGVAGADERIMAAWEDASKRDKNNPSILIQLAASYAQASESIDPKIAGTGTDTDKDGLSDERETQLGSDPKNQDSNNNTVADGEEVKSGFNPAGTGRLTSVQLKPYISIDQELIKKSEATLKQAIAIKPDLAQAYLQLSSLYENLKRLAESRAVLDEGAKQVPNNVDIRFGRGRLAYNSQKYLEAERIFKEIITAVPNHANSLYSLGLVYLQKGDQEAALKQFEKVREITGPNVDLEKTINELKEALNE